MKMQAGRRVVQALQDVLHESVFVRGLYSLLAFLHERAKCRGGKRQTSQKSHLGHWQPQRLNILHERPKLLFKLHTADDMFIAIYHQAVGSFGG